LTGADAFLRNDSWLAYQFNCPCAGDGIIMAFRREMCSTDSLQVKLKGLEHNATYEILDNNTGKVLIKSGEELSCGFTIFLGEKRNRCS